MMLVFLAASALANGDCAQSSSAADVRAAADGVADKLLEHAGAPKAARADEATMLARIDCLDEQLAPEDVAAVLLARGLVAWFVDDPDRPAAPWFAASRSLEPTPVSLQRLAPSPQTDLAQAWAGAEPGTEVIRLDRPPQGLIFVDGRPGRAVPKAAPYFWQHITDNGVVDSALVGPGDPPPDYAARRESPAVAARSAEAARSSAGPPVLLITGGALAAIGTGSAVAFGATTSSTCTAPDADGDGFSDCPAGVNAGFYGGLGAAVVGGGLLVGGLLTRNTGVPLWIGPRMAGIAVEF